MTLDIKKIKHDDLPDVFNGFIVFMTEDYNAIRIDGELFMVKKFHQQDFGKKLEETSLTFRRFDSITYRGESVILSSDQAKVWSPKYGSLICKNHPMWGKSKKFAPVGKVYRERNKGQS